MNTATFLMMVVTRFQFEEGTIRLAEIDAENERVLNNFSEYFELVT
ncbi:MAG: hypothetical protein IPJ20_03755 [Flammeovirgaceae bacterium]|nr:hypothetical protein [Flammeovirgaceae bacterium]